MNRLKLLKSSIIITGLILGFGWTPGSIRADEKGSDAPALRWSPEDLGNTLLDMRKWHGNDIGKSDEVMPPWTPMTVTGQTIGCWGREYVYRDTLFPAQILSQGTELLAESPWIQLQCNGKTYEFRSATVEITRQSDALVRVVAESSVGDFTLKLEKEYEYDGMAAVTLTLTGIAGLKPDRMELIIPWAPGKATLAHYLASPAYPPMTDACYVPAGGLAFDDFRNMIWLGDTRVGLCWFAEGMENWPLASEEGIQVFRPDQTGGGRLTIKLADKPFDPAHFAPIVFGLQATPMRPREPRFREKSDRARIIQPWTPHWADGQYYPFTRDYEAARRDLEKARESGREVQPVSSLTYYGRYRYYEGRIGKIENPGLMNPELLLWGGLWSRGEGRLPNIPEEHAAKGDWHGKRGHPSGLTSLCPNSPWQDFFLWRLRDLVENTGLKSFYLDQPAFSCRNQMHGCGYIDSRGQWRSRIPIFAMREMIKRIRRVFYETVGEFEIRIHISNQILVPVLSFADTNWDGEVYGWAYRSVHVKEFYSKLLSEGRMLAQHTGLPFGFAPDLLPQFKNSPASPTSASVRDMAGLFFVHDANVGPIWTQHPRLVRYLSDLRLSYKPDDMEVAYYWDRHDFIRIAPYAVRYILHYDRDKALLVLFNWSDAVQDAELFLNTGRFAESENLPLRDILNRQVFEPQDATYRIPVAARDLRMLEIKKSPISQDERNK